MPMGIQRFRKSRGQSIYDLPVDHPDAAILTLKDYQNWTSHWKNVHHWPVNYLIIIRSKLYYPARCIHGKRNKSIAGAEGLQLEE